MNSAKYIVRVGALALLLGIGATATGEVEMRWTRIGHKVA